LGYGAYLNQDTMGRRYSSVRFLVLFPAGEQAFLHSTPAIVPHNLI
jgi:hypothetical protein